MKTYKDYEKEYHQAIAGAKEGDFVVKKDIWISCKWEQDTGFFPFAPDAEERLRELEKADKKLWIAVVKGMLPFINTLKKKAT